jgi:hypothetical protein
MVWMFTKLPLLFLVSHHELEYPHSHCLHFHLPHQALMIQHQALLIQQLQVHFHPKKTENEYKNLRIR